MARYTPVSIFFFSPTNFTSALEGGASRPLETVSATSRLGEIGTFDCTYPYPHDDGTVGFVPFGALEAVGNVVILLYTDNRYPVGAGRAKMFGESYRIESVTVEDREAAGPVVRVSGRSLLAELEDTAVWEPIGDSTVYNTTLDVTIFPPSSSTAAAAVAQGADKITLADASNFFDTNMVIIPLAGGGTCIALVSSVDYDTDIITLDRAVPDAVSIGATITRRPRKLFPVNAEGMEAGAKVVITLDSGTFTTIIEDGATTEDVGGVDKTRVLVRDGITGQATAGNAVATTNYSAPATDDISQIIANASGWSSDAPGFSPGTSHMPGGASVFDLLNSVAEINNTRFRLGVDETNSRPLREIEWGITPSGGAGQINFSNPPRALISTTAAANDRGIVFGTISREWRWNLATRIYATGGDASASLYGVSSDIRTLLATDGYIIVDDQATLGLWAEPYMYNDALEPGQVIPATMSFTDIVADTAAPASSLNASDMLALRAAEWLARHNRSFWEWRLTNVEVASAANLRVGEYVDLTRYHDAQQVKTSYAGETISDLITREVTMRWSVDSEMPVFDVALSDTILDPTDAGRSVAQQFKAMDSTIRRVATGKVDRAATVALSPVGPPAPPSGLTVHDHGDFHSGLSDDDHTQYWNNTRGDAKIATHTAIPAAHHALVTAGNTAISVAGQAVSVALKSSNSELEVSSGLGVLTTGNAKTTPSRVLKGDSNGDITLRFLTADKVVSPELETSAGDITLDPFTGKTINDGNLEFTGARSITTSSGSLTLAPVSDLLLDPASDAVSLAASATLKSANWSSGFLGTGWGMTYAGALDCRSMYADELHVAAFIADTARVKVGAEYITPSMAITTRSMTIPAVSSTTTLYVEDAPGLADLPVFDSGDWVMINVLDRSGGGLAKYMVWGQVTSYSNLSAGEQSWTFTTRSANAAAISEVVGEGSTILDFGKSGDGWLWLTSIDSSGSPYLGITTWQGSDPYTEGNRSHKLRLGQLMGTSGLFEWGLQAGQNTSNFIRFSDLRSEIHGSRLSLYAGDGAQLRARAVRVEHYRDGVNISYLLPDADGTSQGVLSTGANFYSTVDENPASPTTTDYIYNGPNQSGVVFMGLNNPTWTGSTARVDIHVNIETTGFSNDTVRLYGQIFASDEMTPLTSEKLIYTATTNTTTTPKVQCDQVFTSATQAQWNAARLRLRWDYAINASEEAIRLDPNVPSIAVGNPLPTDYLAGGSGLWAGLYDSAYRVRIGHPTGPNLRWTGTQLRVADSAGTDTIVFDNAGASYFAGPMTIGTGGGIYQGTGTFSTPTSGLKIYNSSGQGTLALYNGGTLYTAMDYNGMAIRGAATNYANQSAIRYVDSGGTAFAGIYGSLNTNATARSTETGLYFAQAGAESFAILASGNTYIQLDSASDYMLLSAADLYVKERGIAVGYTTTPALNRGQIASDFAGEHDYNALVLQDTTDIAHGMTDIVGTATYGALGKANAATGGLQIIGAAEGVVGTHLWGYGTSTNTTTGTGAAGAVIIATALKSGTGITTYADADNILVVRNSSSAKFLVKGNGDFHYDGTGAAYDAHDDVGLLRALARETWGGVIQSTWDKFVTQNRQNLIDAGVLSDGGFINGPALNRLLTGSVWQLHERLSRLEAAMNG